MQPLTDEQKKTILECETEVVDVLKKHGCHLEGATILRPGNVDVQIVIAINPPDAPTPPAATPDAPGFKVPEAAPAAPSKPAEAVAAE